jgi:hypothetical protein
MPPSTRLCRGQIPIKCLTQKQWADGARSARAALTALVRSGVVFRREWKLAQLRPWEGPFGDPTQRKPHHPKVAAKRREAKRRSRERQRARQAATPAAERDDAAGDDIAA